MDILIRYFHQESNSVFEFYSEQSYEYFLKLVGDRDDNDVISDEEVSADDDDYYDPDNDYYEDD